MERGGVSNLVSNLHQSSVGDDEVVDQLRYQRLLEDYLRLQEGLVSKKRMMQNLRQKRFVLQAEVRFLRKRYQEFLKTRTSMPKKRKLNQSNTNSALEEKASLPKKRKRNQSNTKSALEGKAAAAVSFPLMENKIEMEPGNRITVERVLEKGKSKEKRNKKTVEKKNGNGNDNGNGIAAPVSYPIMERIDEERAEQLLKNSLVVDNTGKMGKKKRVTWQDQVVPKV